MVVFHKIAEEHDKVSFLAQVALLWPHHALHLEHVQPVKGEPTELDINLEVSVDELSELDRVVLVSVLKHYFHVQSWLLLLFHLLTRLFRLFLSWRSLASDSSQNYRLVRFAHDHSVEGEETFIVLDPGSRHALLELVRRLALARVLRVIVVGGASRDIVTPV